MGQKAVKQDRNVPHPVGQDSIYQFSKYPLAGTADAFTAFRFAAGPGLADVVLILSIPKP